MNQTAASAERGRPYVFALRVLGSASRWWPFLLVGAVSYLGWEELRRIDLVQVGQTLHSLSSRWLVIASVLTLLNLALLGCYDLITLEGSPVPRASRWGLGTIAFAWSNFLTLGPIAGPATRFLLFRPYSVDAAAPSNPIGANLLAFAAALAVCFIRTWALPAGLAPVAALGILGLLALLLGRFGRREAAPGWARRKGRAWAALFGVAFLDWGLAAAAFVAFVRAAGEPVEIPDI